MRLVFLAILLIGCISGSSQTYDPLVVNIPTTHGDSLEADVYLPDDQGQYPVILIQTPYNKWFYRWKLPLGIGTELESSKYAVVVLDWRGRFANLDKFDLDRDNGEDGYDVIEWIAQQKWSTGKIGTWGPSALGGVQYNTAKYKPPHHTCAVPVVLSPQIRYKKYFPGGVARTEYLQQGDSLGFGFSIYMKYPYNSSFWDYAFAAKMYPDSIEVPMLFIGGWYDQNTEDMLQLFDTCRAASHPSVRNQHRLLMGPWVHGGFGAVQVGTDVQGELTYSNAAGMNDSLSLRFFDYHLRGIQNGWQQTPFVQYYQMGDDEWVTDSIWPPINLDTLKLQLTDNRQLVSGGSPDFGFIHEFNYNPQDPSPTVGGKTLRQDLQQGPYDQRDSVESRNDVLIFSTPILTEDIVVKGVVKIYLYVSSNTKDTDFAVRLTDVYPDGRSMLVSEGIQRMRFRNGYHVEDTAFMEVGEVYPIEIELESTSITYKTGHQLRLIVSGSNYPRFNRNMNTGEEMYPGDNSDTLVNPLVAKNVVHTWSAYPSRIELPVVSGSIHVGEHTQKKFEVYPNPTQDVLFISGLQDQEVELISASGEITEMKIQNKQLNVSGLPSGLYMLRVRNYTVSKFLKE